MLGAALAQRLSSAGHDLRVFDERPGNGAVCGDLRDAAAIGAAVDCVDGVFHTAALHGWRNEPDRSFFEVNVVGTWNLLEAMQNASVGRLVHSSRIGVYGSADPTTIGPDTDTVVPDDMYGASKWMAEHVVALLGRRYQIDAVSLRYGAFRELVTNAFGEVPAEWEASGALVDVDDVVEANIQAMARLPMPRFGYVVAPRCARSGARYQIDASATEADLGIRLGGRGENRSSAR